MIGVISCGGKKMMKEDNEQLCMNDKEQQWIIRTKNDTM